MSNESKELYSILKASPLLAEATTLLLAHPKGISLTELAEQLHQKLPPVHRVLKRLPPSVLSRSKEGRVMTYKIMSSKRGDIETSLKDLYSPTKTFILGELLDRIRNVPNVTVHRNYKYRGYCLDHLFNTVFEHRKTKHKEVLMILKDIRLNDVYAVAGELFDLDPNQIQAVLVVGIQTQGKWEEVSEPGEISFGNLVKFFQHIHSKYRQLGLQFQVVPVDPLNPEDGIEVARQFVKDEMTSTNS